MYNPSKKLLSSPAYDVKRTLYSEKDMDSFNAELSLETKQ